MVTDPTDTNIKSYIPVALVSEQLIEKLKPTALKVLEERGALDLAEALGLS